MKRPLLAASLLVAALALALAPACVDSLGDRAMGQDGLGVVQGPVTAAICPDGTTTYGIDVSKWQGAINWSQVAGDGVKFAIIRVSHGLGYVDEYFETNWAGAKANGILRGAYQYFSGDEDPIAQANLLIDKINANGAMDIRPSSTSRRPTARPRPSSPRRSASGSTTSRTPSA